MKHEYRKGERVIITRKVHMVSKTQPSRFVESEGDFDDYSGSARAWIKVKTAAGFERKSFPLINIRPKKESA